MRGNLKTWSPWQREGTRVVVNARDFDYPISINSKSQQNVKAGEVIVVIPDFFIEEADEWRDKAWNFMVCRKDLVFVISTKNPERIKDCLPYGDLTLLNNVQLFIQISESSNVLQKLTYANRISQYFNGNVGIWVNPVVENISIEKYLKTGNFNCVVASGSDYGNNCNFDWILNLRKQCEQIENIRFMFYSTGLNFIKNDKLYKLKDDDTMRRQAIKSGLDFCNGNPKIARAEYPDGTEIPLKVPCLKGCVYCNNICLF